MFITLEHKVTGNFLELNIPYLQIFVTVLYFGYYLYFPYTDLKLTYVIQCTPQSSEMHAMQKKVLTGYL